MVSAIRRRKLGRSVVGRGDGREAPHTGVVKPSREDGGGRRGEGTEDVGDARHDAHAQDLRRREPVRHVCLEAAHDLLLAGKMLIKPVGGVLFGAERHALQFDAPFDSGKERVDAADTERAQLTRQHLRAHDGALAVV